MNDGEKTNHWNSLADELGADPPIEPLVPAETDLAAEEASENQTPDQQPAPPEVSTKRPPQPKPAVPLRPNHWGEVAGELGLEVPPEPVKPETSVDDEVQPSADREVTPQGEAERAFAVAEPPAETEESREISLAIFEEGDQRSADFLDDAAEAVDDVPGEVDPQPDASAEQKDDSRETSDESEERPKRRRRRRRRSSRRSTEEDSEQIVNEDDENDDSPSEPESEPESGRESGRRRREGRDARAKHRSIPTWEEAISVIVTSNIDSRSKTSSGSGRRGRGRGRRGSSKSE